MTVDLAEDMRLAIDAMTFAACQALAEMGVPRGLLAQLTGAGLIGRLRVREAGSRWEPSEDGVWRLILPVEDWHGELVDLVALSSGDPDAWSLRLGEGLLTGWHALLSAEDAAGRIAARRADGLDIAAEDQAATQLRLRATPLAWLIAGFDGICVVDWRPAAIVHLRHLGPEVTLLTDDARAGEVLRGQLQCGGLPAVKPAAERRWAA